MKDLPEITDESRQDSFLDAILSLIGVIIIIALPLGVELTRKGTSGQKNEPRQIASKEPAVDSNDETPARVVDEKLEEKVTQALATAMTARQEVEQMAVRLVRMKQESAELDADRVTLAMHRSIVEEDIAKRRA